MLTYRCIAYWMIYMYIDRLYLHIDKNMCFDMIYIGMQHIYIFVHCMLYDIYDIDVYFIDIKVHYIFYVMYIGYISIR